jgi:uncharacterized protein YcbX
VPIVRGLRVYPIKGLPPADVNAAMVLPSGALAGDRRWALVDRRGRFVNGKNVANIHRIAAGYDSGVQHVVIDGRSFALGEQGHEIAAACGEILGEPLTWSENAVVGFPDDLVSPGPTLVSSASLAEVAGWFGFEVEATRLRFRTNIEVDEVDAFWEDAFYGGSMRVGDVDVQAINPCARCVVPSRDAVGGEVTHGFQKRFADLRRAHLPAHASAALFNHYYRFTVNTRIAASEAGKAIRVGDDVTQK